MSEKVWQNPQKRSVGLFTDLRLYYDALDIADLYGEFSKSRLEEGLSKRVKGLIYIEKLSARVVNDLTRELIDFGWIKRKAKALTSKTQDVFLLTKSGKEITQVFRSDIKVYRRQLILKMHELYTIPGWFVNRLWEVNPQGQGEIVIPAPLRKWNPESREWEDNKWSDELSQQVMDSFMLINKVCPCAFPIKKKTWLTEVQIAWERLSNLAPRGTGIARVSYAPRRRLFSAMKEAAVKLLMGNRNPVTKKYDFESTSPPLTPRKYMAWCPRLAELGLIFYTDFHPKIPGRLIFPVSVFKKNAQNSSFEELKPIKSTRGESLFLHHPKWENFENFVETLYEEYQRAYSRVKSLYVSLLDVRDEVCRRLRLSADYFDIFLKNGLKESLDSQVPYSISLETDIREDQGSGYQILRRPIVIDGKPYSLIAMTKMRHRKYKENYI